MTTPPAPCPGDDREWISELIDGRATPDALAQACEAWKGDAELRRTVYTYHLIGDVLRSDDLASRPAADVSFLAAVQRRLAEEPVILAPQPLAGRTAATRAHRPAWAVPAALAASVVAVAGVLVVLDASQPGAAPVGATLADGTSAQPLARDFRQVDLPAPASTADMLRDAQLDAYLRAHRETLAGAPPALPGGALRSVEFVASPER